MKSFKDFNISSQTKGFEGDKIKIKKILNKEIVIQCFMIKDSKYKDKCLHLQIVVGETKHILFTGSKYLIDSIERVPKDGFPFRTTIIQENERFEFT